ncbi:MAG: polysaccharide deacetylase family protein [Proteobacteria bacterium]|nr:polysaccharide deacetylase family protein [Pseudomonadota bacterium]
MTERRHTTVGWRRRLAALAVLLAGAPAPAGAAEPAASAVIFAYQRFGDDGDPSNTIAVEQFEAHLRELRRGGYAVLPVGEIVAALRDGKALPDHAVGITIDDAHVSVYTTAWPRLRAAGLPFTVFVSSETLDTGSRMSWAQLRELAASGVTIGNQTAGYVRMIDQDRAYNIGQILRAQDQLRAMLGDAPKLFAYPYGEATTALRDMVAGMRFDAAFGIHSGVAHSQADRFQLPRFPLADAFGSIERFRLSADALPLVVSEVSPTEAVRTENPPHVGFTIDPAMGDLDQLACFASGLGRARVEQLGGRRIEVRLDEKLLPGRTRINCTLPTSDGRWRWFGLQLSIP